jgi:hypothetical protein
MKRFKNQQEKTMMEKMIEKTPIYIILKYHKKSLSAGTCLKKIDPLTGGYRKDADCWNRSCGKMGTSQILIIQLGLHEI